MAQITTAFDEGSSGAIKVNFGTDILGVDIIPDTATYTITDSAGNIINSQEDTVIATLANDVYVVFDADDLVVTEIGGQAKRVLTIKGTYSTSIGGTLYSGLDFNTECSYPVTNLVAVT